MVENGIYLSIYLSIYLLDQKPVKLALQELDKTAEQIYQTHGIIDKLINFVSPGKSSPRNGFAGVYFQHFSVILHIHR